MKSKNKTIIYGIIALLFMALFVLTCYENGAILSKELAKYIGTGPVTVIDVKMLFEIFVMIYPFFAILLFAPLTCMLLRKGSNLVSLFFAFLWTILVFVMEIYYASDINGNTIGLLNMDLSINSGSIGWFYLSLIVICFFSSSISAIGFKKGFDDLICKGKEVKGILLSLLFSYIIMNVVSVIAFIPAIVMAYIKWAITNEDIPTIFHAYIDKYAIIGLIIVSIVLIIIAIINIIKWYNKKSKSSYEDELETSAYNIDNFEIYKDNILEKNIDSYNNRIDKDF